MRAWIAAAACAVAAVGCGTPAALLLPPPSPPGEALAWFPDRSVAVALAATDPGDPGVARILRAVEKRLPGALSRAPALEQLRPLLGNDLAVGVVAPGDAPLAVLVTRDGGTLDALAAARVNAGLARPAGSYRGAELHAADDHAFAVRQDVLLVSGTTGDLREALDRRAREDGLRVSDLPVGRAEVRARLNTRAGLIRLDPRLLAVPWLAAAERLDAVLRADADAARVDLRADTRGDDLVPLDVPLTGGAGALMAEVPGDRLAFREARHVLTALERGVAAAAPLALVRAGPALPAARRLAAVLDGPATVVRRGGRLAVRADTAAPGRLARRFESLLRALSRTGVAVQRSEGFHEVAGIRFGLREGGLVAGDAPPRTLERLARARLARPAGARGSAAVSLPSHGLAAWASATPRRAAASVRLSWP